MTSILEHPGACFTVAQIARALDRWPRVIRRQLGALPPAGEREEAGNKVRLYSLSQLPADIRTALEALRGRRGYRSISDMLKSREHPWCPAPAYDQQPESIRSKAEGIRDILAPLIAAEQGGEIERAEACRRLVAEMAKTGRIIGDRQARRLLERALDRDGGREEWHRPELYVDERTVKEGAKPGKAEAVMERPHESLRLALDALNLSDPLTVEDRAFVLDATFRHLQGITEGAGDLEFLRAKRSVLRWVVGYLPSLTNPPGNYQAVSKRADRAFPQWIDGGQCVQALGDKRKGASGRDVPSIPEAELEELKQRAIRKGSLGTAWTFARQEGALKALMMVYPQATPPRWIYDLLGPAIKAALIHVAGPRKARLRSAPIMRDWSGVEPGDRFTADDKTFDCYVAINDGDRWGAIRPQLLLIADERSLYIPGGLLIPSKHYTVAGIRKAIIHLEGSLKPGGLPRLGFWFENGFFRAKQIIGSHAVGRTEIPWRKTECGLRHPELGLEIKYHGPANPRAKMMETILSRLRRWFVDMPGYAGTNERENCPQRTKDSIARLHAGSGPDEAGLLTWDQWCFQELPRILTEHNNHPGNGEMLNGASPAALWEPAILKAPLKRLPDNARHLLASDSQEVQVRENQVRITIGTRNWVYTAREFGQLEGRWVEGRFNYEHPEFLSVFSLRGEFICTAKAWVVDARASETPEGRTILSKARSESLGAQTFGRDELRAAWRNSEWVMPRHRVGSSLVDASKISDSTLAAGEESRRDLDAQIAKQDSDLKAQRSIDRKVESIGLGSKGISVSRKKAGLELLREALGAAEEAPESRVDAE